MGPAPPIGTHRYVFMLFQQPNQEPLQASCWHMLVCHAELARPERPWHLEDAR